MASLFFWLKKMVYNIIEQHENKEMALTYDKYTYRTNNVMHRRCRVACLFNKYVYNKHNKHTNI